MYAGIRVARGGLDIVAEEAARLDLPAALLVALAYGESGLQLDARGDNGASVNWYQVNQIHPGWPDRYLGVDGIRESIRLMAPRWQAAFRACGGWGAYTGLATIPPESALPPVPDNSPPDPRVPRRGRAAVLYHFWPRAQGSVRPSWERALECDAVGSAVWGYYQDLLVTAATADPRVPHLVGALSVSREEVAGVVDLLDTALQRLQALARGIDAALEG